jgi:hypothetical protein
MAEQTTQPQPATPDGRGPQPRPGYDRDCRLCRCPLAFAANVKGGTPLPLDLRAPVYVLFADPHDGAKYAQGVRDFVWQLQQLADPKPVLAGVIGVHPLHHATCSAANEFGTAGKVKEAHRQRLIDVAQRAAAQLHVRGGAAVMGPAERAGLRELLLAAVENREVSPDAGVTPRTPELPTLPPAGAAPAIPPGGGDDDTHPAVREAERMTGHAYVAVANTGEVCFRCGSPDLRWAGACKVCNSCGESGGCG